MNFKEWLAIDERFKGLERLSGQRWSNMPDYVRHDLYTTRVGPAMNRQIKPAEPQPSESPNADLKSQIRARLDSYRNPKPNGQKPVENPSQIINRAGLDGVQWTPKPVSIEVNPFNFDDVTLERFQMRRYGYASMDDYIRSDSGRTDTRPDSERTATQRRLMQSRGTQNEPIIVLQNRDRFQLMEGWHRTMNYLLTGAPPDQLDILRPRVVQTSPSGEPLPDPNWTYEPERLDYSKWKPVQLQAYVGTRPNQTTFGIAGSPTAKPMRSASLPGTGDYLPIRSGSLPGTGDYIPNVA